MRTVRDDIWLCVDCTMAAVNGDVTGVEPPYVPGATREEREAALDARIEAIWDGLAAYGPHLVPDFDGETGEGHDEFSSRGCDSCPDKSAGELHRFAVLGE